MKNPDDCIKTSSQYPQYGLTKRVTRGGIFTVLNQMTDALRYVFLVPLFLSAWGSQVYGEWLTISALVAYLSFANAGIHNYVVNSLTQSYSQGDLIKYTKECIDLYREQAQKEQASLTALPKNKKEIEAVQALNDVTTCYFIQAESLMRQEKNEEAKKIFKLIIDKYSYGQAWDPRGWFWSIRLAAQQSIKKIETGSIDVEEKKKVSQRPTKLVLFDPGKEDIVDYGKYGEFKDAGTKDYKYTIVDQRGLIEAVGEGVYPNNSAVRKDPIFKQVITDKRLEGDIWDFLYSPDLEAAFVK